MKRRALVLGAVAVAAIAAGTGVAVWRARRAEGSAPSGADVWDLSFVTIDGPPLAMSTLRGRPLLLNFWATWCVPCVTEMPILDAFARAQSTAGWNVLALAIDSADPVRRFTAERGLRLPVALAGEDGLDLARRLGNTVGGLPFTVAFDTQGAPKKRKFGAVDKRLLDTWAASV
jgi:thiol-disulfide isomerase/thioredoxin